MNEKIDLPMLTDEEKAKEELVIKTEKYNFYYTKGRLHLILVKEKK